jgi:hypothetical protein
MATKKTRDHDRRPHRPRISPRRPRTRSPRARDGRAVEEHTDPAVLADVEQPKTYKVKSPAGDVVEVPESILDALLDSGYSKTK